VDREEKVFKDVKDDWISTDTKRDLTRMVDLKELKGERTENLLQERQVDLVSLTIREDDTFMWFVVETVGDIGTHEQFAYHVSGYVSEDFLDTDPFDFRLIFSNGTTIYYELSDGKFKESSPVSSTDVKGSILTVQVNKGNFIIKERDTPYTITAISTLDEGTGEKLHIDYVVTKEEKKKDEPPIDDTTLIILQFVILGFAFVAVIIIWKVYLQKKGDEDQGGICPKCESRLDANLDFCPSCGTFIRGPKARSMKPGVIPRRDFTEE
jgi:hypothetical protein